MMQSDTLHLFSLVENIPMLTTSSSTTSTETRGSPTDQRSVASPPPETRRGGVCLGPNPASKCASKHSVVSQCIPLPASSHDLYT